MSKQPITTSRKKVEKIAHPQLFESVERLDDFEVFFGPFGPEEEVDTVEFLVQLTRSQYEFFKDADRSCRVGIPVLIRVALAEYISFISPRHCKML